MLNWLRKLFRRPRPLYAVIYDRWDGHEWIEDMYEVFLDEKEAFEMFTTAYGDCRDRIANPRLVLILKPVPGKWATIEDTPE